MLYTTGSHGFRIYDLTEPRRPALRSSTEGFEPERIVADGGVVYDAASPGLEMLDARDPDAPRCLGALNEHLDAAHIALLGDLAFVSDSTERVVRRPVGGAGIPIFDVREPERPRALGTWFAAPPER